MAFFAWEFHVWKSSVVPFHAKCHPFGRYVSFYKIFNYAIHSVVVRYSWTVIFWVILQESHNYYHLSLSNDDCMCRTVNSLKYLNYFGFDHKNQSIDWIHIPLLHLYSIVYSNVCLVLFGILNWAICVTSILSKSHTMLSWVGNLKSSGHALNNVVFEILSSFIQLNNHIMSGNIRKFV